MKDLTTSLPNTKSHRIIIPRACTRGKVIGRVVVVVVVIVVIHKKSPDLEFKHLSDSKVQRICQSWRKNDLRMLRIQASQIVYFSWTS